MTREDRCGYRHPQGPGVLSIRHDSSDSLRSLIIEGFPGRPATKPLAASPGPDGSPSSKAQTRVPARGFTGANRPRSCDSDGTQPTESASGHCPFAALIAE
jgi:hypothetical protein